MIFEDLVLNFFTKTTTITKNTTATATSKSRNGSPVSSKRKLNSLGESEGDCVFTIWNVFKPSDDNQKKAKKVEPKEKEDST